MMLTLGSPERFGIDSKKETSLAAAVKATYSGRRWVKDVFHAPEIVAEHAAGSMPLVHINVRKVSGSSSSTFL